jgi:hypothetical protein
VSGYEHLHLSYHGSFFNRGSICACLCITKALDNNVDVICILLILLSLGLRVLTLITGDGFLILVLLGLALQQCWHYLQSPLLSEESATPRGSVQT